MTVKVVIPAYRPTEGLVDVVTKLGASAVDEIVVVNDGSGEPYEALFDDVRRLRKVRLLRHAVNLGKGAALKSGINACLCDDPHAVVVTADADGQHLPEDILRVATQARASEGALVLGTRTFGERVPLRSRLGNIITKHVLRIVLGYALHDTQTGLRAIPAALAPHLLRLKSSGYEFELDMLIICKQLGLQIVQTKIQTVYIDGNASSHFDPLLDSMRIYFALLRFVVASLSTAILDNAAFIVLYAAISPATTLGRALLLSQVAARAIAMVYNYAAVKKLVFASKQSHARVIPKYLLLVVGAAAVSYSMIRFLGESMGVPVVLAKIMTETLLFFPNFVIQRDLVFRNRTRDEVIEAAD